MLAGLQERLQAAIFLQFGEPANWPGIANPVLVIVREEDVDMAFNGGSLIGRSRVLRVRRSEVEQPLSGTVLQLQNETVELQGEPTLNRKGVWVCSIPPK